jgi:hypothetical protein
VVTLPRVGALENDQGEQCALWADHLVGRAPEAALRLEHAAVSWRHASLRWTGRGWELQDLGSLNGTFLNDVRVEPGSRNLLRVGSRLRFGEGQGEWSVIDIDPPDAVATAMDDGSRIAPQAGLIVLPSPESPELSLYRRADGVWVAEAPDRVWEPQRDEIVIAGGRRFRFEPGSEVHATSTSLGSRLTPGVIALEFTVSRNEEQVDLSIVHRGQRTQLKPRAHTYLLLTLARLRSQDQTDPALPPTSHGWVEQSRLLRMLATSLSQLTLDIYRARRQFAETGMLDPAQIVERRTSSRELRIGVERLSISTQ